MAGLGLVAGAFVAVVIGLGIYVGVSGNDDADAPGIVATLAFELLIGAAVLLLAARRGISLRRLGFVLPRRWGIIGIVWTGSYAVLVAYQVVLALLDQAGIDVSRFRSGNPLPVDLDDGVALVVLLGIAVVVVAPLSEELFFRALIFRGLRGYWRLLPSLAVSGLIFGAFHGNLSVVIPFTFVGALFAWGYEESDSLITPIVAHVLVNSVSFALTIAGAGD